MREEFYDDINFKFSSFLLKLANDPKSRFEIPRSSRTKANQTEMTDELKISMFPMFPEMRRGLPQASRYVGHYSRDCLQSNVIV